MKLKSPVVIFSIVAAFITLPFTLLAQGPGDPGGDPDPNPPGHGVPFDGGLSLLIAAGVGYASKKAYDKRKKDNISPDLEK